MNTGVPPATTFASTAYTEISRIVKPGLHRGYPLCNRDLTGRHCEEQAITGRHREYENTPFKIARFTPEYRLFEPGRHQEQ